MAFNLKDLEQLIAQKAIASTKTSYTAQLLENGGEKAAKKMGEEAVEVVIAALKKDKKELTYEAADLLYHLMVVLKAGNVSLEAVLNELERRTDQSGLQEKAARTQ